LGVGRSGIGRKGFLRNRGSLLGKVIGCSKVVADELHFPGDVTLQQYLSFFVRELTMNGNGGGPANGGYVTLQFAALLEVRNCSVENDETGRVGGIPVTVAIDPGKTAVLLQLLHQVLVEGHLKFGRQADL